MDFNVHLRVESKKSKTETEGSLVYYNLGGCAAAAVELCLFGFWWVLSQLLWRNKSGKRPSKLMNYKDISLIIWEVPRLFCLSELYKSFLQLNQSICQFYYHIYKGMMVLVRHLSKHQRFD